MKVKAGPTRATSSSERGSAFILFSSSTPCGNRGFARSARSRGDVAVDRVGAAYQMRPSGTKADPARDGRLFDRRHRHPGAGGQPPRDLSGAGPYSRPHMPHKTLLPARARVGGDPKVPALVGFRPCGCPSGGSVSRTTESTNERHLMLDCGRSHPLASMVKLAAEGRGTPQNRSWRRGPSLRGPSDGASRTRTGHLLGAI